jgi:hypothetical protein
MVFNIIALIRTGSTQSSLRQAEQVLVPVAQVLVAVELSKYMHTFCMSLLEFFANHRYKQHVCLMLLVSARSD